MPSSDLRHLLDDARVLAWYATRNGKLPVDSKVFDLIGRLEASVTPEQELVLELQKEMDALVKSIAPMTLKHLLQRGSLMGYARHTLANIVGFARYTFASITPIALGVVTLLLTFYLAFQSSQLSQADTAVREYQQWVNQQPNDKLYTAWKMYRYERVLHVQGPPLAQLDAYQKLVEEARQSVEKGAAIQGLLNDSALFLYLPRFLETLGPTPFRDLVTRINAGYLQIDVDRLKPLPASPGDGALLDPCKDDTASAKTASFPAAPQQQVAEIDAYANSYECFLYHLHISELTMTYSPWAVIYQTKAKINLLVTWMLPGLYGLLGACVYLLRDLVLSREKPADLRDRRITGMLERLLRIALGGLAGIIIGWFWVPSTPSGIESLVAVPISSIPFGLAFIAGFSIRTLFSLLDRVNRTLDTPEADRNDGVAKS